MQRIAFNMALLTVTLFITQTGSTAFAADDNSTVNRQDKTLNDKKVADNNDAATGCNPATGEGCDTKSAVPTVYDGMVMPN